MCRCGAKGWAIIPTFLEGGPKRKEDSALREEYLKKLRGSKATPASDVRRPTGEA